MKQLLIKKLKQKDRITKLAKFFNSEVKNNCGEYNFHFDNEKGRGEFHGINYECGISILMLKVYIEKELVIEYDLSRRHPVLFNFMRNGHIELESPYENVVKSIQSNEAIIFSTQEDNKYLVKLPAHSEVECIFIEVIRNLFLKKIDCPAEFLPEAIKEMFRDTEASRSFYFTTSAHSIILDSILRIFKSNEFGLERTLLLEAKVLKLITSLVSSYRKESKLIATNYWFSNEDIDKINKIKNYLTENLKNSKKVHELAQMVGMNENKLQNGFRLLVGNSIRQFLITMRMHKASFMLDENNYTVSEIAYLLGYTNKSHFSQLFRRHFGILPSEYKSEFNGDSAE